MEKITLILLLFKQTIFSTKKKHFLERPKR